MKHRSSMTGISLALMALLASASFSNANAQGGPPGGGPPRGGPGQGPGFGGPGRPGFGGPRTISIVDVPVTLLTSELKLSAAQTAKIAQIQKDARQQRQDNMPHFGGPGSDPANRPDMMAIMTKMRSLDKASTSSIEAVLTAGQKKALPALIKQMDTMRRAGIPAEVYSDLKLTADQKQQMAAIAAAAPQPGAGPGGMRQNREKLLAVLTADQRAKLDAYMKAHPRRGFGGPGGPGGFGGPGGPGGGRGGPGGPGGFGGPGGPDGASGPPPPDGNAPPPPDDNGPPPPGADGGPPPPEPGDMPNASR